MQLTTKFSYLVYLHQLSPPNERRRHIVKRYLADEENATFCFEFKLAKHILLKPLPRKHIRNSTCDINASNDEHPTVKLSPCGRNVTWPSTTIPPGTATSLPSFAHFRRYLSKTRRYDRRTTLPEPMHDPSTKLSFEASSAATLYRHQLRGAREHFHSRGPLNQSHAPACLPELGLTPV